MKLAALEAEVLRLIATVGEVQARVARAVVRLDDSARPGLRGRVTVERRHLQAVRRAVVDLSEACEQLDQAKAALDRAAAEGAC